MLFMRLSRRRAIRIISFLSAVVITLGIWAGVSTFNLAVAERELKRSNERALTQLGTYLDDINLNLQKCMYSQSKEMLSDVSSKLWRSSASAKENLSEITDGNTQVSGVYKFLSQVGEYTLSLNEQLASGKQLSKEDSDNLNALLNYSKELSDGVNYLISQEENGLLDFEEIKSTLQNEGRASVYLGDELNDANQSLEDYPTLIYDGPFSDHINNKKST
jgi:germination protein YpeB